MYCIPNYPDLMLFNAFKCIAIQSVQIYCAPSCSSNPLCSTPFCIWRRANYFIAFDAVQIFHIWSHSNDSIAFNAVQMIPLHSFKLFHIIRRLSYYSISFEAVQIFKLHSIPFILSHYIRSRSKPLRSIPFKFSHCIRSGSNYLCIRSRSTYFSAFETVQIMSVPLKPFKSCQRLRIISKSFKAFWSGSNNPIAFDTVQIHFSPWRNSGFEAVQIILLHSIRSNYSIELPYELFYCIQIITKSYFTFEALKSHFIWWGSNPVLSLPLKSTSFGACQIDWIVCRSNYRMFFQAIRIIIRSCSYYQMTFEAVQIIPLYSNPFKLSICIRRLLKSSHSIKCISHYLIAFDAVQIHFNLCSISGFEGVQIIPFHSKAFELSSCIRGRSYYLIPF